MRRISAMKPRLFVTVLLLALLLNLHVGFAAPAYRLYTSDIAVDGTHKNSSLRKRNPSGRSQRPWQEPSRESGFKYTTREPFSGLLIDKAVQDLEIAGADHNMYTLERYEKTKARLTARYIRAQREYATAEREKREFQTRVDKLNAKAYSPSATRQEKERAARELIQLPDTLYDKERAVNAKSAEVKEIEKQLAELDTRV